MSYFGAVFARGETPPQRYQSDDFNQVSSDKVIIFSPPATDSKCDVTIVCSQMGGNFVVTRVEGSNDVKVTHIHRSKFTIDRPPVRDLLKHVVSLNK